MSQKPSKRDKQLLFDYLDDQISVQDKKYLESRLKTNSELQNQLKDYQNAKRILKATPELKTPKDFFLLPEMVKNLRFRISAFGFMRFASSLAGLLLFVLVSTEIIYRDTLLTTAEIPSAESAMMDQSATTMEEGESLQTFNEKSEEPPSPTYNANDQAEEDADSAADTTLEDADSAASDSAGGNAAAEGQTNPNDNQAEPGEQFSNDEVGEVVDDGRGEETSLAHENEIENTSQSSSDESNQLISWIIMNIRVLELIFLTTGVVLGVSAYYIRRAL